MGAYVVRTLYREVFLYRMVWLLCMSLLICYYVCRLSSQHINQRLVSVLLGSLRVRTVSVVCGAVAQLQMAVVA